MDIDFSNIKKVHFIGIGGVGISALARLMLEEGKIVSGTNDSESKETLGELEKKGVVISRDLDAEKLPDADLYVHSDAWLTIHTDILEAAHKKNVPVLSYFEALGLISKKYKVIAIAGAHGKTTTTAMLADVLEDAGLDPTVVVGSIRAKTKSNFRAGKGDYLVVEADEFRRHFLNFTPYILVILNIDDDHLDYYKDIEDIKSAFIDLVKKIEPGGSLVCDLELPHIGDVAKKASVNVVDYELFGDMNLELKIPGAHMISNAAAVFAVADILEIPRADAKKSLENFSGTWRRFEYKGQTEKGAQVYDDYGHHPTEVKATLKGARELFPDKKITVIFQPHLYSRTKQHLTEFGLAFSDVNHVVVAPIFGAREAEDTTISSAMLSDQIIMNDGSSSALQDFNAIEGYINENTAEGDVIITMGAGDIYKLGEKLVKRKIA